MSEYPHDGPSPPENSGQGVAPPHSIESEQGVLGAVLLSDRAMYSYVVESQLKPEDFYRERHRVLFGAMVEMYGESQEIDVLTVTEHLRARAQLDAAGGQAGIDELTAAVPAVGNIRRYGEIVKEMSLMRHLLDATYQIQASVHGRESLPRDIVEQAERTMLEVAHDDSTKAFAPAGTIIEKELEIWHKLSTEGIAMTGTPSGFVDLDTITGGFQPGNLIILAARPSMGKCLTGEALVHDPRTGVRRRLDALVQDVENGDEAWVTSLGADLQLRPQRVSATARNGRRPVFRLGTKLGRGLTATANHPLLTVRGWKRVDELEPGDRIAVPRVLPRTTEERTLPDAEVVLLAALIADGNLTEKTPRFTYGSDSPVIAAVEDAATAMGVRLSPQDAGLTVCLSAGRGALSNPVTELCRRHGAWGSRSSNKFVPDAIFRLVDHQIARFLSVLYACDGHVYASARLRQIGYTTISPRLAADVQHLLLRFGVVAKIRELPRPVYEGTDTHAYEVLITGQTDIRRFVDEIGVLGKSAAMARAVTGLMTVRSKTNVDTAPPEAWALVDAVRGSRSWASVSRGAGYPSTHNWHVGSRGLSRARLAQLADVLDAPELDALATSDVWWDEILSIDPAGEQETFDIEVPGDHNFIANDIVVHNSALVTNIAENVALHPERPMPVALFSLEMSEGELAQRFVASQASVEGDDLRKGRMKDERKWKKVLEAASRYDRAPLFVDDSSDIGVLEIRAKARRLHQQMQTDYGGLGLIIIDYLQLMRADGRTDNRVEQVGQMSRGLKILARELDVPVIALSQLSRGVESRTDKRPMLSDLRECVTGDTLVQLADGRRVPIADLVGQEPEVVAVDEHHRSCIAVSDRVWPVGRREVFTLRLASGRSLRATAEHRVLAGGGWEAVGTLEPGDRVALCRDIPEPASPESWPDDHLVLLGQMIGDGSYLSGQPMRYATSSEENSAAVQSAAERAFGATVTRYAGRRTWHQLLISGNGSRWAPSGVNAWLRELGIFNQRSHEKRVPTAVFELGDEQIGLLLQHLWAADGTVWVSASGPRRTRVSYATNSAGLAADVCALLLRLGIVARRSVATSAGSHRPMHHVVVSGAAAQLRFLELVGAFGPRFGGGAKLLEHLAFTAATTNVDTLPVDVWADVRATMRERKVTTRAMAELRGTSYGGTAHFAFAPSRATAAGYAELLEMPDLAEAPTSDLFWDRVVGIEPAGEEEVFDLTVLGPACWLADGIVTHNSGAIEQDADLCVFIYRDEYYNPDTTEAPGEGELIIAKHRNGSLGTVNLVFQGKYTRFRTLTREYE